MSRAKADEARHIEGVSQRWFEGQPGILAVAEGAVESHPLLGEPAQIDVAATVAAGDVVVGLLDGGLATGVLRGGLVVEAHVGKPRHAVAAAVEPGDPWRAADREVDLTALQVKVLGDLGARLTGAHDQHRTLGELIGFTVLLGVNLGDRIVQ